MFIIRCNLPLTLYARGTSVPRADHISTFVAIAGDPHNSVNGKLLSVSASGEIPQFVKFFACFAHVIVNAVAICPLHIEIVGGPL